MRPHFVVPFFSILLGCSLPLDEAAPVIRNSCNIDDDCGPTGSCVSGTCVAKEALLDGLTIVIEVPSDVSYGGGGRHVLNGSDLGVPLQGVRESGFFFLTDLVANPLAEVTARLSVAETACAVPEGSFFPLGLELQPVGHPTGLGLQSYSATPEEDNSVEILVPAGRYDIYLTPDLDDKIVPAGCAKPPFILYDRAIPAGSAPLMIAAPETITVSGTIRDYDATGWTIQLVENGRGRPISSQALPSYDPTSQTSTFEIQTYAEVLFSEQKSAILKLQPPPESEGIPTVLWDAVAAFNGDASSGFYTLEVSLAALGKVGNEPKPIELTVFSEDDSGVPATVTLQAKSLFGGTFGGNLVYKKTFETDPEGKLPTMLVPGVYEIVAEPLHDDLAITTAEKTIDVENLGSISLELGRTRVLDGTVATPLGAPAYGLPVVLLPPTPGPATYLQNQLSTTDLKLGGGATITDGAGSFGLRIDPGEYDLFVQPDPATELPWKLVPRLSIPGPANPFDPLALALTHPAVLTGQVRAASGELLGGAIVRAFLPADDEGTTVVQVAEATVGPNGAYRLLLPGK